MLYLLASIPCDDEEDQDEEAYDSENEAIDDDDLKNDPDYVLPEGADDDEEETLNKTTRDYKWLTQKELADIWWVILGINFWFHT